MLARPEYFILPFLLALVGVIFRVLSRKDATASVLIQDLGVGPELMLSAIVLSATKGLRLLRNSVPLPPLWGTDAGTACLWLALCLAIALLVLAVMIRHWGWKSSTELAPLGGVMLPLAIGLISLSLVSSVTRGLP